MPDGRVLIAEGNPLAESPSWERFDELSNCRCAGWDITVGRSSVFEKTDVGTATVRFNDRAGVLDVDSLVGCAIQLQIRNPVTDMWEPSFRGVIDEPEFTVSPTAFTELANVQLNCVDLFAYLARVELVPGQHGHPPDSEEQTKGSVYYAAASVDDRIIALLTDAQLPSGMRIIFTGNVYLWDTFYDAGESILNAIRDAADAEIPGIANCYVNREGKFIFHGRYARFFPEEVVAANGNWDFTRWRGGDGAAVEADSTRAQVRSFGFSRPSSLIYNAAIAWPREIEKPIGSDIPVVFPEKLKGDQVETDDPSILAYGYRAMPPMGDLIIWRHANNGTTGAEQCQLYAEFFVLNYRTPQRSIRDATFKAMWPEDSRAEATWDLLTRIDISDALNLTISAGGVENEEFFVEGLHKSVRVLNPEFDMVEVTPNLTPASRYAENVFGPYPGGS